MVTCQVCKAWRHSVHDEILWKRMCVSNQWRRYRDYRPTLTVVPNADQTIGTPREDDEFFNWRALAIQELKAKMNWRKRSTSQILSYDIGIVDYWDVHDDFLLVTKYKSCKLFDLRETEANGKPKLLQNYVFKGYNKSACITSDIDSFGSKRLVVIIAVTNDYSRAAGCTLLFFDALTGNLHRRTDPEDMILTGCNIRASPNGRWLSVFTIGQKSYDNRLYLWDVGRIIHEGMDQPAANLSPGSAMWTLDSQFLRCAVDAWTRYRFTSGGEVCEVGMTKMDTFPLLTRSTHTNFIVHQLERNSTFFLVAKDMRSGESFTIDWTFSASKRTPSIAWKGDELLVCDFDKENKNWVRVWVIDSTTWKVRTTYSAGLTRLHSSGRRACKIIVDGHRVYCTAGQISDDLIVLDFGEPSRQTT